MLCGYLPTRKKAWRLAQTANKTGTAPTSQAANIHNRKEEWKRVTENEQIQISSTKLSK